MLKRFTYALLALTLVFASCSKDNPKEPPYIPPGPYDAGIIYYGSSHEDIAFYDPAKDVFYEGNLFEEVNGEMVGEESTAGGINDVCIYDGNAYFFTPSSSDPDFADQARIAVTKADTYKLDRSITVNLAHTYSLAVVNPNKFYVFYNTWDNIGGIKVVTVNADGTSNVSADIEGTAGALGQQSATMFQRMVRYGNYVLAACGSRIQFINMVNDKVDATKTIELDPNRQIADIVKGRDGYIYALVAGAFNKTTNPYWMWSPVAYTSKASIIKITPGTYTYTEVKLIEDTAGGQINIKSGGECNGAVASLTSDEIFFTSGGAFAPCKIYSYNYTTNEISLFAEPEGNFGKYMATDKRGYLYAPIVTASKCNPVVYKISDKTQDESIDWEMGGDGGFVSTYYFK